MSFLGFRVILLFLVQRGRHLQMEISLINVNVLYKRVTLTVFQRCSCLCSLSKYLAQNNPYTKEAYFGVAHSATLISFWGGGKAQLVKHSSTL